MNDPTKPVGKLQKAEPRLLDLQDVLLALGFLALTRGVAAIYWPAALILAGLIFFTFALLIERAKKQ
jgi:hypothetical protein